MTVMIAGGGIGGLSLALTCHQIGVPVTVYESVRSLAPLGVGINLQPNAVRELYDLGFEGRLESIGIEAREWALVARNGTDVWSEPRGRDAGYRWPQFSVHRGELQMLLYREVIDRLGPDAVQTSCRVVHYETASHGVTARIDHRDGTSSEVSGSLLIGADGLHSAVRQQMHPNQPPPQWGGQVLWRGAAQGKPLRTGASFMLMGSMDQRFVHYPLGPVDPATGTQLQNWIAELTVDRSSANATPDSDWNRPVDPAKFIGEFAGWSFGDLDIEGLVDRSPMVWEFPMVDRDPVDTWVDGNVCLLGDAAHVMYPVGSNGASQAIVDARVLGAKFIEHGVHHDALAAFEADLLDDMSALVLRNRGHGPIGILGVVEERCGGDLDVLDRVEDLNEIVPRAEIEAYMARYKSAAGFARDTLHAAPPTIAAGARVQSRK